VVFSDPVFLFLFLPAALLVVALAPRAVRNAVLLCVSLLFYAWGEQEIVFVMLASIAVNHALALRLDKQAAQGSGSRSRKLVLAAGVAFNLGVLVAFKYASWLWNELQGALVAAGVDAAQGWAMEPIHVPIGVSFFTFQALSYVVDVYRERVEVRRNPLHFALYIALFPQLVAGPIVRFKDLADQIAQRVVKRADVAQGARRFVIGLGKKVLIADVLAVPADLAFGAPADELTTSLAWIGLLAFTLQIYFDFSGYSDMAIGISRMFGFRLLENFRWPLIATSLTDFWRRWHISLSTWFRDYLYIPLGGNRRGPARTYLNLTLVFLLCGLWHGASWNFIAWGLFHGGFLIFERAGLGNALQRMPRIAQHAYLLVVVMASWVLFRVESLQDVPNYAAALIGRPIASLPVHTFAIVVDPPVALALLAGAVGATPAVVRFGSRLAGRDRTQPKLALDLAEACGLLLTLAASLVLIAANGFQSFIYFRF
jgi:alginate O-acetyltransferase complex protein AlgI